MKKSAIALFALLAALAAAPVQAQLLNEMRIDHGGTDVDEYFEIAGTPGQSLTGLHLVVLGDGTTCSGVIETVVDLTGRTIQADGLFCGRMNVMGTPALTGYDATVTFLGNTFENGDNVTFLLVTGFTGAIGNDLDTNDDGVLDATPWTGVLDQIAFYEGTTPNCATNDEQTYATRVGPDGSFVPGHIFRCGSGWYIGPFAGGTGAWPDGSQVDTPGGANNCATPTTPATWGKVKAIYR